MGAQTIDKGVKSPAYKIHRNQDNLKVPKSRKMANLPSQGTIQPGCSRVLWGTLSAVGTLQHCHWRFLDYSWHEHLCSWARILSPLLALWGGEEGRSFLCGFWSMRGSDGSWQRENEKVPEFRMWGQSSTEGRDHGGFPLQFRREWEYCVFYE